MKPFARINLSSVLSSVALAKGDALRRGILVSSLAPHQWGPTLKAIKFCSLLLFCSALLCSCCHTPRLGLKITAMDPAGARGTVVALAITNLTDSAVVVDEMDVVKACEGAAFSFAAGEKIDVERIYEDEGIIVDPSDEVYELPARGSVHDLFLMEISLDGVKRGDKIEWRVDVFLDEMVVDGNTRRGRLSGKGVCTLSDMSEIVRAIENPNVLNSGNTR